MTDDSCLRASLEAELNDAESKAWDSLARYKLWMFGYYAAAWVRLNRVGGFMRPNPFADLVQLARQRGYGPQASRPAA